MYRRAQAHFKKADPKLYKASLDHKIEDIIASTNLFGDIVWAIIGQQLSGKAADTIYGRFEAIFPDKRVTPEAISKIHDVKMREAGLSGAKTRAMKSLAASILSGDLKLDALPGMADAQVIAELTKVKGIGPWTAEMILMHSLGRADIFARGDLGLQKGLMHLYGLKKEPSDRRFRELTDPWSPYRTYAARILWRVADAHKLAATGKARVARRRPSASAASAKKPS